jgi:hypothetical protein
MEQKMNDNMQTALVALSHAAEELARAAAIVEALGDEIKNDGKTAPAQIAEFYFHLDMAYEGTDTARKRVYHVVDMFNKFIIPTRLRDSGMDLIRVAAVARSFSVVTKTSATLLDKEKGFEWLRQIGQGDVIQETVNAGTLSALCRNLVLDQGIDPPPDIVNMRSYDTTSMTKYKPKVGEV